MCLKTVETSFSRIDFIYKFSQSVFICSFITVLFVCRSSYLCSLNWGSCQRDRGGTQAWGWGMLPVEEGTQSPPATQENS